MSPEVKDECRQSGSTVGLLVSLSASDSSCPRLRPSAGCALADIAVVHFMLNVD